MLIVEQLGLNLGPQCQLDDINLTLARGEMLVILGANGAGKSTLLSLLCGARQPDRGRIRLNGQDLTELSAQAIARQMARVPQQQDNAFDFTALEMVVMGRTPLLGPFSAPSIQDQHDALAMMEGMGLATLADQPYQRLSGGERQLVLLARARLQSSELLLLDEPTNHLDQKNRYAVLEQVHRACRQQGCAVIAVLHEPNLAQLYADKVLMLKDGRVLAYGPRDQVMTADNLSALYDLPTRAESLRHLQWFVPESVLQPRHQPLLLLTGNSGSGKTTLLQRLCQRAPSCARIDGLLTPGVFADGQRQHCDALDIVSAERHPYGHHTGVLDPITQTRFRFDPQGLALAQRALSRPQPAHLHLLDEVGPMELRGHGLAPQLPALLARADGRHIWVVRPSLLEAVQQQYQLAPAAIVDAADPNAFDTLWQFSQSAWNETP
ncbi:ATP-binding cassette domain-containing protein [Ferrimonas balearica]|uniref:ATP-binding cassette domain-containing protein n=1 Tax=Ferrimonas balearica TaxID=44012 RepID=UPI001C59D52E|nr:ATP-binding cassette domain-containing protein [Ferrimonas balearica]MBW3138121.1 ATP-binding cassette domain-containing protein [Ferrimonas balearica]